METNSKAILKTLVLVCDNLNAMNCLSLKIIALLTVKTVVLCDNGLIKASVMFPITSYGRLPGALLLIVSKDIVGDCLYACMQHSTCLTVNYHTPSRRCELVADLLYKNELIQDVGWIFYGHFESELVRYIYCYVHFADEHSLVNWNINTFTAFLILNLPSYMQLYVIPRNSIFCIFFIGSQILHSKK